MDGLLPNEFPNFILLDRGLRVSHDVNPMLPMDVTNGVVVVGAGVVLDNTIDVETGERGIKSIVVYLQCLCCVLHPSRRL